MHHLSLLSALAVLGGQHVATAAALPSGTAIPDPFPRLPAPALPTVEFETIQFEPLELEEALNIGNDTEEETEPTMRLMAVNAAATCANPRVRVEWDSYSNSDRTAFVDAIKCLMNRPASGAFSQATNRYEDLVALHQTLTPNVHGNHKFLIWHRYFTWTFEDMLRSECGFNRAMPWFDETRYAGRYSSNSIFSDQWFGAIGIGGRCVSNGQFANLALNVGPGTQNRLHCLARNGDAALTSRTDQAIVDACNSHNNYPDMATCSEGGAHAWGHNGIGAVMRDMYSSPGDPVFFLHHAFIDRNWRIWQNQNSARRTTISGTDSAGNPLTLDTIVNVWGFRPDVRIRDILDTTGETLCYKYNY